MRNKKTLFTIGFFLILSAMSLIGADTTASAQPQVTVTPEMKEKFPSKPHHAKLSLKCIDCHEGQGNSPEEFKEIGDKGCLSCHKSKEYVAQRLKFMDKLHVNPHNSVHDGTRLSCDECHNEHKPSENMCSSCHSNDVPLWMRKTP